MNRFLHLSGYVVWCLCALFLVVLQTQTVSAHTCGCVYAKQKDSPCQTLVYTYDGGAPCPARFHDLGLPQTGVSSVWQFECVDQTSAEQPPLTIAKGITCDVSTRMKKYNDKVPFTPFAPTLEISIPGFKGFSSSDIAQNTTGGQSTITIPFLAQYLSALYLYLISIVGIIAAVMIIWGGFQWVVAGGNSAQIGSAKERIAGAVVGLILALGSYSVLYFLNPDLVRFKSLVVPFVSRINLEDIVETKEPYTGAKKPITDTTYDAMFQKFAACNGVDWRIYKAFSWHESGLNPTAVGGKKTATSATGLFQTYRSYCAPLLKGAGWDSYCDNPGITNPAVNTAIVTAGQFKSYPGIIRSYCSSASFDQQIFMLYFAFGNGGGGLKKAINAHGCATEAWLSDTTIFKGGPPKFTQEMISLVKSLGATSLNGLRDSSQCPFNTGATVKDFPNS